MNSTVEYYNQNAESFIRTTLPIDMSSSRDRFLRRVLPGGRVLDAGCGSGRDSRAFMQQGYSVVAFDASSEMCRMATEYIRQKVLQMRFDEMDFDEEFDGVWACASILHVPVDELPDVLAKIRKALKKKGILYVSFKYGEGPAQRGDRTFSDFREGSAKKLLSAAGFEVIECGVTSDIRPGRGDEKWVNVIARKI